MNKPTLSIPGFELRTFTMRDAEALALAVQESQVDIHRWMDWAKADYAVKDAEIFIKSSIDDYGSASAYDFGIFSPGNALCGVVSINTIHQEHRNGNIGYWVRSSFAGRGITTAAVRAIVPFGFERLYLVRLEIVAAELNVASRRVAEKVGAQFECVARNRLLVHGAPTAAAVYSLIRP